MILSQVSVAHCQRKGLECWRVEASLADTNQLANRVGESFSIAKCEARPRVSVSGGTRTLGPIGRRRVKCSEGQHHHRE